MTANNRFGGGVEFEVESVAALPSTGRAGRMVFRTTDGTLHRDNGTEWVKIALGTDPPIPHQASHQDGGSDAQRGTIKIDGIEATAIPSKLGVSTNTGNITFDSGKGTVIRSPNGHRWQIVVNNIGTLGANDLDA